MKKILIIGKESYVAKSIFLNTSHDITFVNRNWAYGIKDGGAEIDDFLIKDFDMVFYFLSKMKGERQEIINANCTLLKNVIDYLSKENFSGKFCYISTVGVRYKELIGDNYYIESKIVAEGIVNAAKLNSCIFRLSFPVGYGEGSDRMLSQVCLKLLENMPISLDSFRFSPILLSNHCNYLSQFMLMEESNGVMDLVSNLSINLIQFAEYMREIFGSSSEFVLTGRRLDFTKGLNATIPASENDNFFGLINEYSKFLERKTI